MVSVASLGGEVEFGVDGLSKFFGQIDHVVALAKLGRRHQPSNVVNQGHIALNLAVNARALDLQGYLAAILEHRFMGLGNGTRCDRAILQPLKQFLGGARQVAANVGLNLLGVYGGDGALQGAEFFDVGRGHEVGASAQQLTQLDVHWP